MIKFDVNWIESNNPDPLYANTAAELCIAVDERHILTNVLSKLSNSSRDTIRVPLYPFAEWLAFNWWRLHKETRRDSGSPSSEWLLAHNMSSIGGGLVWPDLEFFSEQKVQRAFATEFLVPINELRNRMEDFSEDEIERVAELFGVSPLVVRHHLVNHKLIPPYEDLIRNS